MKKCFILIITILCIAAVVFAACSVQDTPAEPVDASASVSEPTPEPEPEPEPEFHCDFDIAVEAVLSENQENPDIDLESDPTPLYEYLVSEGIDSYYVQSTMCDNAYATGFIRWVTGNDFYNPNQPTMVITDPNELHLHQATPEELEEEERIAEEFLRQMEAEAAEAEANAGNNHGRGNNF